MELDDFYKGGPRTLAEAFPAHCYKTHWDPSALTKHVLPASPHSLTSFDPRPLVRVCTVYRTSGQESLADNSPIELPPGGAAGRGFPFAQFRPDTESDLTLRDYELSKCAEKKFQPKLETSGNTPPKGMPEKEHGTPYEAGRFAVDCRRADDDQAWKRSAKLFFNHTRYDRVVLIPKNKNPNKQ